MTEAIFPVFGPMLIFLGVLPLTALVAKLILVAADRVLPAAWAHLHQEFRYFMVVMASAAPLVWFASASLHQAESGEPSGVCSFEHGAHEALCLEPWFFALALFLYGSGFALVRSLAKRAPVSSNPSRRTYQAEARVAALITSRPGLRPLAGRCRVHDELPLPIATMGPLVPRVALNTDFVERLDDEALAGALHHELEHVRAYDPLRYLLATWALYVNPWGRIFLNREMTGWRFQRELSCDREAVANGADAAAMAKAIVTAARRTFDTAVVALGNSDALALKLRVHLLLSYTERRPQRSQRRTAFSATALAVIALAVLPHRAPTWALDAIHVAVEQVVLSLAS